MSPFLQLAFSLAVILAAAKLAGYISTRLGQPSVLGELLVGILLGPSLLDLAHLPFMTDIHLPEILAEVGEMGVWLIMFIAGLELHISDLTASSRVSALAGTLGVVLPLALGWGVGLLFGLEWQSAVFLGLVLGATSVSISAQTLIELKALRTRVGLGLLGAAVFDDVLVILLLSVFFAVVGENTGVLDIVFVFVRMAIFLGASVAFGSWVLPRMVRQVARLRISQGMLSLALVIMLVYGLAAEILGGVAAITGTFLAGLMFARSPEKAQLEAGLSSLAYGFFAPIFFVSMGLGINLREMNLGALWLMLASTVVAIVGKWFGSTLGALWGGFPRHEALQLGAGMIPRGEVGLIVVSVGIREGLADPGLFSAAVGMVLATSLVTPPILQALFANQPPETEIVTSAKR